MNDSQVGTGHKVGAFQVALLIFTILVFCSLIADTVLVLPKEFSSLIHMVDTLACAVFFGDFCVRLYRAESKLDFMKWGWIDLVACVPNLQVLRFGRMIRALRIIRLLRGVRSVQKAMAILFQDKIQGSVVSVVFGALLLVAFSSVSILVCERQGDANIKTAEDAVWWSVTTITTVGYGDKYPVTTEGRVVGVILMVAGVSMFGTVSGLAASFFLGAGENKLSETKEILAKLNELHAKVDALGRKQELRG
jgi:voltage-gated potassium channel